MSQILSAGKLMIVGTTVLLFLGSASPSRAAAQSPLGVWGGLSLGGAWQIDGGTSGVGPAGAARIAYRLSPGRVSVGLEGNGAAFIETIGTDAQGVVTATATVWAHTRQRIGGAFVKAGFGFGYDAYTEEKGPGWMVGGGYDLLLGGWGILSPAVTAHSAGGQAAVQVGVGLNFR